jgi:transcriptional regulator with XRE-family HTH domain
VLLDGDTVRSLRRERGVQVRVLCGALEYTRRALEALLAGRDQPTLAEVRELAVALDVSPTDLVRPAACAAA